MPLRAMTAFHTTHPPDTVALEPSRLGRRRFIAGAGAVAAAATVGTLLEPATAHASLPAGASNFHILAEAYRAAHTARPSEYDFTRIDDLRIRVPVAGVPHPASTGSNPIAGVPADATAVVLTVTALNGAQPNNVRAYPSGPDVPRVSNLNLAPYAVNANMVTVKLSSGGSVDVRSRVPCTMIVDVVGYYAPVELSAKEGRYYSLDTPRRVHDTKPQKVPAKSFTTVDVTAAVPANAGAVMINLTADDSDSRGFFSALPATFTGTPTTSNLNVSFPGDTRAGAAVVPVATDTNGKRKIKIYARTGARIIVDVFGYFTNESATLGQSGLFVPLDPERIMHTGDPGQMGRMWPKWVVEVPLPAAIRSAAAAVVVNVTSTATRSRGHLRVSAARRPIPATSNLNWTTANATVPNHCVTTVTHDLGLQAYNLSGGHVIVDLAGYYTGTPQLPASQYQNPPVPTAPPPWTLYVPKLNLISSVFDGDPTSVTNSGHSWHWTGTGYMGQSSHVSVFGHRTDAGGPYRYVHTLAAGDVAVVYTSDGREYTYRYARTDIVLGPDRNGPPPENILAATRLHPGTTFSMIACTYPNGLPTSLNHRIIITFELVSWREI